MHSTMLKQSPSRIQRTKMLKVKHVLQVFLLSAVCACLVFQLRHSYYKKQEFGTNNRDISNEELAKLGRKGLLFDEKFGSVDEAVDENEEELELEYEFNDGEMREEEDDDEQEIERGDEGDEREEDKDGRGRKEDPHLEREGTRGKEVEDGGGEEDEKQLTILAKYDERDGNNDPNVKAEEIPIANQTVEGSARDKEEFAVGVNNTKGSVNGNEQVHVNSIVADTTANIFAKQNYSGSFESTQENATSIKSGVHDESESPSLDKPTEKSNTTLSQDGSEDQSALATNNNGDATATVEDDRTDRPTLPAIENEVKNVKDKSAE